jgi:hypothetical protein
MHQSPPAPEIPLSASESAFLGRMPHRRPCSRIFRIILRWKRFTFQDHLALDNSAALVGDKR